MEKNQTVLITGATSGIGKELAKLFAQDGYNLIIVARNEERLAATAEELRQLGPQFVEPVSCDLSVAGNAQKLYDQVKQNNLTVDILVNDAGAGEHGFFTETSLEEELAIIQLNIASLVHLTKLFLKEMVARNEGKILQLASVASYQPTPKLAVYAATKAFVLSFSDALINELKDTNVTITSLIPGPTDTDFFVRAHAENTKATENMEEASIVAQVGYDTLMQGEPHAVAPGMTKQIVMSSVMSNQQIAAMARKQMEEKETSAAEEDLDKGEMI